MGTQAFGHLKFPVQRVESGYIRPLAGAQVYIYTNRADGTPSIDSAGNVLTNAILASLFSGPNSDSPALTQPLTTDAQGYIDCYTDNDEYHYRVILADGSIFGMLSLPFFSSKGRYA